MDSKILQNPSDPDATYREKAGKKHRGYAANVEESVGKEGSVVTNYQFDDNTKSDSEFFREHVEKNGPQEQKTVFVADGAFSGEENTELAAANNMMLGPKGSSRPLLTSNQMFDLYHIDPIDLDRLAFPSSLAQLLYHFRISPHLKTMKTTRFQQALICDVALHYI